ncbi:hypothetical protein FRC12_001354 [Ceratobasidium sp. 428]|nr:hypothetical protein FRC12_001354 [Ceratobasidium sp. 428]
MAEHIWGPEIEEYSMRAFEPQISEVSNSKTEAFKRLYDVPPLAFVESSLRRCDPRVYGIGNMKIDDIIITIGKYAMVNNFHNVFKYYYGFVTIRHLSHITCLAALGRTRHSIDTLVARLPQNACWTDLSNLVAAEAVAILAHTTRDVTLFDECCDSFGHFRIGGLQGARHQTLEAAYTNAVAALFWKARDSFLMLCQRGLLPGAALLLVVALRLTPVDSNEEDALRNSMMLQDLAFRLYLVGSRQDQQVLQLACMPTIKAKIVGTYELNHLISPDDSRAISRAYVDLLPIWRQDPSEIKGTSIYFMTALSRFVLHMLGFNPAATAQEHLDVTRTSFKILWRLFEAGGQIPVADYPVIRSYGETSLYYLGYVRNKCVSTADEQYSFTQMLVDVQVIALAGRIMLLTLSEGNEFEVTNDITTILETLSLLESTIKDSVDSAPELFYDSKIEWVKILAHCVTHHQAILVNLDRGDPKLGYMANMISTWLKFEKSLKKEDYEWQECAYPRCFRKLQLEVAVHYMCGQCDSVAYCNSNCQRAHWELATSESHKLTCGRSDGQQGATDS